ncbi:CCA tRNA nucleotidyltransferase [Corynebacterium pseudotuberculosis]|uniref:CCA tRNA nucleotidyltransferase n=1 Tax=Corynebacterium pseudotuberculosis (strain C231) TaxID=681645 RepID=D9QDF2_CORP2|nr:CCA tRNA nucleotidyltransferase [Corynebacterium pseudotuberculosis]ADK29888.1 CCA tRNA nucleotidyltransferase [Corynebacterium pseudotuberculosis FRC41]ADL11537.1 CCA tRNA nucleotidyltransferase [Corynebacterium pseudotuberculosis C231]ADL21950.1 CCA tRNA nucleotidyltransferase [Corynebacterium pseudotuberculosis 1002]ADO27347.1 CCA tRNA nucleotidyltransferase [Corynebacterium pseudotuberculosis I19]AEK93408.1 tRNA nucleotidyltransferase [Corynebacterium pseudotuberculosis PAT10]
MRVNLQSKQHAIITNDGSHTAGVVNPSLAASSVAPYDASSVEGTSAIGSPDRIELLARAQKTLADLSPLLAPLAQLFQKRGHRLYLVGGSVRDALLDELGNDLDFTTDARPETVMEILNDYTSVVWDTGIEFGTVSAEKDGQQIEITTFRSDVYDGKTRNPEVQFGDSLEGDLIRRDFRVNAMAVEVHPTGEMTFHDPVKGMDDLVKKVLDTPSLPEQSFNDDPLRMLRAARFVSQLEFSVADRVDNAMTQMADQIDRITVERIQVELDKLLCGRAPWDGIDLMVDTGLAERIIPEIPALRLTQDEHRQHKDVYLHSLTVLRQAMEQEEDGPDVVLRWASLMHDCGKPDTRAFTDEGKVSFHHHEIVGARIMRARMRALKYSKQMVNDVSDLIRLHMRFHGFSEGEWTDSAVRRYVTDAGPLLSKLHKLVRADCTTRNKKKAARLQRTYDHLEERIAEIAEREDLQRVRPDLDGNEIMKILDLQPGPDVGRAWSFLKELRLERGPLPSEEAIAELKAWWLQSHSNADASESGS